MSNDKAYARCKGCDRQFYPAWRQAQKTYEDLCWSCMKVATYTARVDPVLYGGKDQLNVHPDKWEKSNSEVINDYLSGLASERTVITDSLLDEDEYTRGIGYESGEWFGNDNPFDSYEV